LDSDSSDVSIFLCIFSVETDQCCHGHTMKENIEALVGASKETDLEVNADKTKYMVTC
jgi:hypothetical protein